MVYQEVFVKVFRRSSQKGLPKRFQGLSGGSLGRFRVGRCRPKSNFRKPFRYVFRECVLGTFFVDFWEGPNLKLTIFLRKNGTIGPVSMTLMPGD